MSWKPKSDLALKLKELLISEKDAGGGRLAFLHASCTNKEGNKGDSWVSVRYWRPENNVEIKSVSLPGNRNQVHSQNFSQWEGMTLELYICIIFDKKLFQKSCHN
jgi:hypothetical protein